LCVPISGRFCFFERRRMDPQRLWAQPFIRSRSRWRAERHEMSSTAPVSIW
jgi:hypothetical protein